MTNLEFKEIEEFDKLKTKVLKYVLYKKRTEKEIRQKFSENAGILLDNVIEYLREENYINDENYIERSINEIKNLKNLSIKEIKYKLLTKGVKSDLLEDYLSNHKEEMQEYELCSAKNILLKKSKLMCKEDIIINLKKKGYSEETLKLIGEDYD